MKTARKPLLIWVVAAVGVICFILGFGAGTYGTDEAAPSVSEAPAPEQVTVTETGAPVTVTAPPETVTETETATETVTETATETAEVTVTETAAPVEEASGGSDDGLFHAAMDIAWADMTAQEQEDICWYVGFDPDAAVDIFRTGFDSESGFDVSDQAILDWFEETCG